MADRKSYTLAEAVDYCVNSDIDSCTGGLSSGEEEELDRELIQTGYVRVLFLLLFFPCPSYLFCLLSAILIFEL